VCFVVLGVRFSEFGLASLELRSVRFLLLAKRSYSVLVFGCGLLLLLRQGTDLRLQRVDLPRQLQPQFGCLTGGFLMLGLQCRERLFRRIHQIRVFAALLLHRPGQSVAFGKHRFDSLPVLGDVCIELFCSLASHFEFRLPGGCLRASLVPLGGERRAFPFHLGAQRANLSFCDHCGIVQ